MPVSHGVCNKECLDLPSSLASAMKSWAKISQCKTTSPWGSSSSSVSISSPFHKLPVPGPAASVTSPPRVSSESLLSLSLVAQCVWAWRFRRMLSTTWPDGIVHAYPGNWSRFEASGRSRNGRDGLNSNEGVWNWGWLLEEELAPAWKWPVWHHLQGGGDPDLRYIVEDWTWHQIVHQVSRQLHLQTH